jgi:uncharacterized lipoprotein YmbA
MGQPREALAGPSAPGMATSEPTGTYLRRSCKGLPRLLTCAALALVGCSVTPAPPVHYYRVEISAPASASSFAGRIVVEPFETYGIYTERPLLFRSGDATHALEQYHYQFWAEPPAVALRDSLVVYLRGAFASAQVVQAGGRTRGDLTVHARLKRFEHLLGSPSQAAFAVEFRVVDADDNERLQWAFDEKASAGGASVEDFVAAMDQLVAKAYSGLVERLGSAVDSSKR